MLTHATLRAYGETHQVNLSDQLIVAKIAAVAAVWAVEGVLDRYQGQHIGR